VLFCVAPVSLFHRNCSVYADPIASSGAALPIYSIRAPILSNLFCLRWPPCPSAELWSHSFPFESLFHANCSVHIGPRVPLRSVAPDSLQLCNCSIRIVRSIYAATPCALLALLRSYTPDLFHLCTCSIRSTVWRLCIVYVYVFLLVWVEESNWHLAFLMMDVSILWVHVVLTRGSWFGIFGPWLF
jgi:hypothetical protein